MAARTSWKKRRVVIATKQRPIPSVKTPVSRPEDPSQRLRWVAWGVMALAVLVVTVPYPMGVGDTFVQILTGKYILTHGIPHVDPFSYTAGDRPYTEHEWLSCVLFYLTYVHTGVWGMVLLKTAVVSATCLLVVQTARGMGAQFGGITLIFAPFILLVSGRAMERPHLFSSLALAIEASLFFAAAGGRLRPRWLWALVPLYLLWGQMHGGWVHGVALLGCFALGEALSWVRARVWGGPPAMPGRTVVQLTLLVPICLAVVCLGPYGLDMLTYPLREAALERTLDWNTEWQPAHRAMIYYPIVYMIYVTYLASLWLPWLAIHHARSTGGSRLLYDVTAVLFGAMFLLCLWRTISGQSVWLVLGRGAYEQTLMVLLIAVLGCWVVHTILCWRKVDITKAGMVLLCVGLSFRYARALPDALCLTYPMVTSTIAHLLARRKTLIAAARDRTMLLCGVGLLIGVTGYVIFLGIKDTRNGMRWGLRVPVQLECVVHFFQEQQLTGRVFTSEAPWLLFRLWPSITVNTDTRLHVYSAEMLRMYRAAMQDPAELRVYLQQYPTDILVLPHRIVGGRGYLPVLKMLNWGFVYLDDRLAILVAPRPEHASLVQREGYRHILPWVNMPVSPLNAHRVLGEAERALAACPNGARFAWAYKSEALRLLGRQAESDAARRQVPKVLWIE